MKDQMKFTVVNQAGEERECEVLFTFENAETKTNYIVYTDNFQDEDGNTQVFASIFDPDSDLSELRPIETEEEWKIIEYILEELQTEQPVGC